MPHDDVDVNRVFLLSAPGASALAVVRITGPGVRKFLAARFSRPAVPGRCVHGELRDDAGVLDDPVIVLRDDGRAADITLHGSAWLARSAVALAERSGFILTSVDDDPAAFAAVDASDPLDAEVQLALPNALTSLAARTLLAQPAAWRQLVDQDATEALRPTLQTILDDRSLVHLLHPPTVAIVGLPNAGKSTLANHLFGTDRSIVSPVAGTTRDWVGERANLDGLIVTLVDTPGLRSSDDPIEQRAIMQSAGSIEAADLVLLLLDASRTRAEQAHLVERFPSAIRVTNKWDIRGDEWAEEKGVHVCARTGDGTGELITTILGFFGIHTRVSNAARAWTERQRRIVRDALATPDVAKLRTLFTADEVSPTESQ